MAIVVAIFFTLQIMSLFTLAFLVYYTVRQGKPQEVVSSTDNTVGKVLMTPRGGFEIIERRQPVINSDEKLWMAEND